MIKAIIKTWAWEFVWFFFALSTAPMALYSDYGGEHPSFFAVFSVLLWTFLTIGGIFLSLDFIVEYERDKKLRAFQRNRPTKIFAREVNGVVEICQRGGGHELSSCGTFNHAQVDEAQDLMIRLKQKDDGIKKEAQALAKMLNKI